jgi:hypothetical protein
VDRVVCRLGIAVALVEGFLQHGHDLALIDHQFAAIPGADRLHVVAQQHQIGAATAAEAADFVAQAEAGRAVQRAHGPGLFGLHAEANGFADDPIEAEIEQVIGVAIIGADGDALMRWRRAR